MSWDEQELRRLVLELAVALDEDESAICGEYCGDKWPDCDAQRHDRARALLARVHAVVGWDRPMPSREVI